MEIIVILCVSLGLGYIFYTIIESLLIRFYRSHIKCVIHVNGIRGKSSTTRLIDAGLRECGLKVMSKTTGTIPTIIDVDNNEIEIKRKGSANIREQIRMLRKAYKDKVDYLVLECMAVSPRLQYVCEHNILKANITIITNIREDHIGEMGNNLDEIAEALLSTTPTNGYLITPSSKYNVLVEKYINKYKSKLILSKSMHVDNINNFDDNIGNALEVATALKLDKSYLDGMSKFKPDYGQLSAFKIKKSIFINGFSINDIDSYKIVIKLLKDKFDLSKLTILLNNREDRPTRIISLFKIFDCIKAKKVILVGSNKGYCKRKLHKKYKSLKISYLKNIKDLEKEHLIFGVGNIKNDGIDILEYYKNGEQIL